MREWPIRGPMEEMVNRGQASSAVYDVSAHRLCVCVPVKINVVATGVPASRDSSRVGALL